MIRRTALPTRISMTDIHRSIDPLDQVARLTAGDALIFRHYELGPRERWKLGAKLQNACRSHKILFLVAGDSHLALTLRADGLHLPGWYLRRGYCWQTRPNPNWLVTAAAHSRADLVMAERQGADAALLSPLFATKSHPGARQLGVLLFAGLAEQAPLPVYALGGLTERSARRLCGTRLAGTAGVSAL